MALLPCPEYDALELQHREWLSAFDGRYRRKWDVLRNGDYEPALCEAAVRRLLSAQGCTVQPNEDVVGKAPGGAERRMDFRCSLGQRGFLVEVACIPIAKATEVTGLPHPFAPTVQNYGGLYDEIFKKCRTKTSQCSEADLPSLLAVGTFHTMASALCMDQRAANMLLAGKASISWNVNTRTGQGVGEAFQTTRLYSASFLQPGEGSLRAARKSLSGLLLCGFGCDPPTVLGMLHPFAARPFDPQLLPEIQFGTLRIDETTHQLWTSWPTEASGDQ